jgi:hypothetical protein
MINIEWRYKYNGRVQIKDVKNNRLDAYSYLLVAK